MRRTGIRWIATSGAVAALLCVLFTCRRGQESIVPPADTPSRALPTIPRQRTRSRGDAPESVDAPTTPAVGGTAFSADIPEDDGYPFTDVEVSHYDGTPAGDAEIYALAAGKLWTEGADLPHVRCVNGRGRLHVLRRGVFDVGAVAQSFAALVEDVEVPRAGPLRITLPAPASVVVRFEQPLVPDDPAWEGADIKILPASDNVAPYPGRAQRKDWSESNRMDAKSEHWTVTVPAGACCVRRFDNEGLVVSPATFIAPAEVRVRHAERYPVKLNVTYVPADATFAHAARIESRFFVDDDPRQASAWTVNIAANQHVGDADGARVGLFAAAPAPDGEIRWRGPGVVAGSTTFRGLGRDADNVVEVRVRVAEDPPAPPPHFADALLSASVLADSQAAGTPSSTQVCVWFVAEDGSAASIQCGADKDKVPAIIKDGGGARWALAARGDWTANVATVDPTAEWADVSFVVAPGGYVVPRPKYRLPSSLGEVELRRRDGAPFMIVEGDGTIVAVLSARASPSFALGPFPPGDIDFIAEVRGEPVGELHATVRAGERTMLDVPSFAPR